MSAVFFECGGQTICVGLCLSFVALVENSLRGEERKKGTKEGMRGSEKRGEIEGSKSERKWEERRGKI